ncbi:MAG: sigma-70 family RNA polymerase sigma factor [Armatimonadota bacterium]|nr:sigma-70 family RNA polymerase sigma factor [Armatimonadota bacterium]
MPDDDALLARARAGDLDAFEELVRAYQDRIYDLAYRITGNREDAVDAAQDAFVRAYQALPRFRQDAAFGTWLYRTATNAAVDLVRRRAAGPPVELPTNYPAPDTPETAARRREVGRRVQAALAHLSPEFRAAVVLRDLHGLAYRDVARILQVPVGTVRSRLARAREALRTQLADLVTTEG